MLSVERIDPFTDSLKQFWQLESIAIVDKGDARMFLEEEESVRQKYCCCGKVLLHHSDQTTSRQSIDCRV